MSEQFYTKEELELLGGSAASDEPFQPSQSVSGVDNIGQPPMQQGIPYQQNMQYQQQMENAPQFVRDMSDPNSTTYRNVHMGISIASGIKLIVFGLIFALVPLCMLSTLVITLRAGGEGGIVALLPILMILLFVSVGISVFVKGIRQLIRALKNK